MTADIPTQPRSSDDLFERWLADGKNIIYQDELVVVFLSLIVRTPGQLLIVPKRNVHRLSELTAKERAHLWSVVDDYVEISRIAVDCVGVMIAVNDLLWMSEPDDVFHVKHSHVHVIPKTDETNFSERRVITEDQRLAFLDAYSRGRSEFEKNGPKTI